MTDILLEQVSAYADGELDGPAEAEVSAALERDAALRKALAAFRKLDAAAATLPVPMLDAETGRALWAEVSFRTTERRGESAAAPADWKAVSSALPPAPAVSEARWSKVWAGVRSGIQQAGPAAQAVDSGHRAALPLDADLSPINLRAVSEHAQAPERRSRANSLWMAVGVMAAAAMILLATIPLMRTVLPDPLPTKKEHVVKRLPPSAEDDGAQVLDDRYFMLTRHVEGVENPVVCFFLKAEETGDNKP